MSLSNRNNPYSFDPYVEWRKGLDYYRDDPFFQKALKHFSGADWEKADEGARSISPKVSSRWRDFSDSMAAPEKRPYVTHYDAHHHRVDRIVRPYETETMEKEIFSEAIFSKKTSAWEKLAKMYLIYQNGEACIACPLVCTEGLIAIIEKYPDSPELERILLHCREGIEGDFGIGAQYLSEIQGGSDLQANVLEAVQEAGEWRLYGAKFFCSATHADYMVVTAKPAGSEKVALFVVPSWLEANREKEIRNGFTIDRIKWKMGTSELPTAEITFHGAKAYPVGPLEKGVANAVAIVLTLSRLTVGLFSAATMTRAAREAAKYSEFREAFGSPIGRFTMVAGQIHTLEHHARRTTAGALKLYRDFLGLPGLRDKGSIAARQKEFTVREAVMLQKITASWDSVDVLRQAMSIFGGHGVMEDFSSLPRLYRDAAVNELWEGPRNVLLTQIFRDIERASSWCTPAVFVEGLLKGAGPATGSELAEEMSELIARLDLLRMDEETTALCGRWDSLCHRLFHAYQDVALEEVEG
ncbi:MAG: acyl-CoA dehydrogenase family protein [Syntrophobacteraceae bacterium]